MSDKRVVRTRAVLEQSFNEIFLGGGYEKATPARIAEAAQVGRSTFYEHFDGRDDLLEKRLLRILTPLADMASAKATAGHLEPLLDHFWDNRVVVRSLLAGGARTVSMRALRGLIEERIRPLATKSGVPLCMIATQIAGGQLSLLEEWLSGRHHCSSSTLAQAIVASTRAQVLAAQDDLLPGGFAAIPSAHNRPF